MKKLEKTLRHFRFTHSCFSGFLPDEYAHVTGAQLETKIANALNDMERTASVRMHVFERPLDDFYKPVMTVERDRPLGGFEHKHLEKHYQDSFRDAAKKVDRARERAAEALESFLNSNKKRNPLAEHSKFLVLGTGLSKRTDQEGHYDTLPARLLVVVFEAKKKGLLGRLLKRKG